MSGAYYNEWDKDAAAWLRELIRRGLIADGEVDERSILDVTADDLRGFTQCHFFAGIGGWSYALRLAGWPDDRPVWTGSPPCQPFSAAGQQKGKDDERHLAPHFAALVAAGRPPVLFGEQVASAAVFGKAAKRAGGAADGAPEWAWIDDLCNRLEAAHYAVGASDLPAACVGAPHIRQRTFFGAVRLDHPGGIGRDGWRTVEAGGRATLAATERSGDDGRLADAEHDEQRRGRGAGCEGEARAEPRPEPGGCSPAGGLADAAPIGRGEERPLCGGIGQGDRAQGRAAGHDAGGCAGGMGDADSARTAPWLPEQTERQGRDAEVDDDGGSGLLRPGSGRPGPDGVDDLGRPGADHGGWDNPDWLFCRDGKWRPVEPGTFPLAHGLSARVGRLRGYGNAIVPQAAAEFIRAFDDAAQHLRLSDLSVFEGDIFS